jgi:3-dehydroquinate synthetase
LTAHALPTRLTAALPVAELMAAMTRDKKMRSGMPRFVVLTRFGKSVTRDGILPTLVEAIWRQVGAL